MGDSRWSRRRLLATLGGATAVGATGGATTGAVLSDVEPVPGDLLGDPYVGGQLRLTIDCVGTACTADDGTVTFAFADLEPPASGTVELHASVAGTPAWLWLRSSTPVSTTLAEALTVTLSYPDGTAVTVDDTAVTGWSLNDVLAAFADGGHLVGTGPDGAVAAGDTRRLVLDWSLPDATGIAGESVVIEFRFGAVQYRAEATPTNPWTGG
jgi:hypothetical protein